MGAAKTNGAKQDAHQLKVPSEPFRIKEMSRKLMGLYNEWVDSGRPLRDGAGKPE